MRSVPAHTSPGTSLECSLLSWEQVLISASTPPLPPLVFTSSWEAAAREEGCRTRGEAPQRQVDEALLYCAGAEEAAFDFSGREMKREEPSLRFVIKQPGGERRSARSLQFISLKSRQLMRLVWIGSRNKSIPYIL